MTTNPLFTNIVLVLIAGLLLVQVIQNGMKSSSVERPSFTHSPQMGSSGGMSGGAGDRNPTVNPNAPNMGHNMFFMAVKAFPKGCEGKKILDECDSPAAQAVKTQIEQMASSGKGPRQIFDYIVETWGVDVLTDQARQIRGQRVRTE